MLRFIKRLFAWWDGVTLGTAWTLLSRGARFVGADEYGNKYYEERRVSLEGRKRRYVVYKGYADASRVPADWHGWLHHTVGQAPGEEVDVKHKVKRLPRQAWETDHTPNLTGTVHAWRPRGSLARAGDRARQSGDYESWTPGD
jgi:NADH:ubiquinone oxidoreductase subunit